MYILRAFDPNHYSCLGWDYAKFRYNRDSGCRCRRDDCCLVREHYHLLYNPRQYTYNDNADFLPTRTACEQRRRSESVRCEGCGDNPQIQHRIVCYDYATTYSWSRQGEQIKLPRLSKATFKTPLDAQWLRLLDRDSFSAEDPSTRHLLWCDDTKCAISNRGRSWISLLLSTLNLQYRPPTKWIMDHDQRWVD